MDKMNLMNKVPNYGSLWIFFFENRFFFFFQNGSKLYYRLFKTSAIFKKWIKNTLWIFRKKCYDEQSFTMLLFSVDF